MTTAPAAGTMLGRYQVLKPLARGGMAEVLLARAIGLKGFERHVVIKRIRVENGSDQKSIDMFLDEARLAGSLHHRNIVQVHDVGEEEGKYFFVMEYVHGRDARELLRMVKDRKGQIPLEHVITIVTAAAAGLHYAHEQRGPDRQPLGIVHRDVSPGNILLAFDGGVKVVDFGIAKAHVRSADTQAGETKGKVGYMSPEQCKAEPIDRRTDIFLLGIVLYELATVRRLFRFDTRFETMTAIVDREIPPPSRVRKDLPAELEQIILKALARSPDDRYRSADELRLALESVAARAGLTLSASRLSDYLKELYGDVPEPWLVDERPPAPDPERLKRASQASFVGATLAPVTGPVEKPAEPELVAAAEPPAEPAAAAPPEPPVGSAVAAAASEPPAETQAAAASDPPVDAVAASEPPAQPSAGAASSGPPSDASVSTQPVEPRAEKAATAAPAAAPVPKPAGQPAPMAWPVDPSSERRRRAWLIGLGILAAGGLAFLAAAFLGTGDSSVAAPPAAIAPAGGGDAAVVAEPAHPAASEDAGVAMTAEDAGVAAAATPSEVAGAAPTTPALDAGDARPIAPGAASGDTVDTKQPVHAPPKRPRRPLRRTSATPVQPPETTTPAVDSAPDATSSTPPAGVRATPTDDGPPPLPAEATPTTSQ